MFVKPPRSVEETRQPRRKVPTPRSQSQRFSDSSVAGHLLSRRRALAAVAGIAGLSLLGFLPLRCAAAASGSEFAGNEFIGQAESCIIVFCWGGMSHLEIFDLKRV